MNTQFLALTLLLSSFLFSLNATHYRAGEIVIEPLNEDDPLTIRASVITYTKASSTDADRQELTVCWGDGNCQIIQRVNGALARGEQLDNDIKINIYTAAHTYEEQGEYMVSMTDPNRIGGILNLNFPFSINSSFHIQTKYNISTNETMRNSSPLLLVPPIDFGCVGQTFKHNPGAFDVDGDRLSYRLVTPFEEVAKPVNEYLFPNEVSPGADNSIHINAVTGDIVWDTPQQAGNYVIAIEIDEWRNGELISTTLRDLQVTIEDCGGLAPEINVAATEFDVEPGDIVEFEVTASTSLESGAVRLKVFGGPMILETEPAVFEENNQEYTTGTVTKKFRWQITEEHLRNAFYTIVFKSTDNQFSDAMGVATLETIIIKVSDKAVANKNLNPYADIKIYPNPTQDFLHLDLEDFSLPKQAKIQIYTVNGKMIYNEKAIKNVINLSHWSPGQYTVAIRTKDGIIWKEKMVIVR